MNLGSDLGGSATAAVARPSAMSSASARSQKKRVRVDRTGLPDLTDSRIGRGYAQGTVSASRRPASQRRVAIKTRIVRTKAGIQSAVREHLRYVQRDRVTREGAPGELYNASSDRTDGKAFAERGNRGPRNPFQPAKPVLAQSRRACDVTHFTQTCSDFRYPRPH